MTERGVYQNVKRARQLLRFDGFRYGNITPTDIDGIIDCHDNAWVLFEVKYRNNEVPLGQRIALERLISDAKRAGKHGIAMIVEHNVDDCWKDVFVRDCMVREVYTTEKPWWRPPRYCITAKGMADAYIGVYQPCPFE